MDYRIRPALDKDRAAIAGFTTDTFAWGDYVADVFPDWLSDPNGHLVVAVDDDDVAVGMSRGTLLSPAEFWLQGARVREDWRRRGMAGAMGSALIAWAQERGARVSRLLVEDWNEPARLQVVQVGLRPVAEMLRGDRTVGDASPLPSGNGGRRVPALEQLTRAHSAEAEPAFMSWTTGPLGRAARGLFPVGWSFRRLTIDDLAESARREALWTARSGWAIGAREGDTFEVAWLETRPEDAVDLIRALVDLATNHGAERIALWIPSVDWVVSAARRAGFELHAMTIFAGEI
jgi:GNAT superfamily N-acetyltransferase